MLIPPKYFLTPKISQLLSTIEAAKQVIDNTIIPPEIETNIRRKSTLKSSLFSVRIEGNTLSLEDVQFASSKDQKKREVFNLLKALNQIYSRGAKNITLPEILVWHKLAMKDLVDKEDWGRFRTNLEAIFNSAGIAIYIPPRPGQIKPTMERLLKFVNSNKESFIPIKAALAHYSFEKIHPFLDGNGRIGRLLLAAILQKNGYGMKGLLSLEEYLDNHRSGYYQALEISEKDTTDYLEFMLAAMAQTAQEAMKQVLEKRQTEIEDLLLPRRAEILSIIKDHGMVNFDNLRRRFLAVNERTLRYDLKKLQETGLIRKRGTTKGVYYEASNLDRLS